MVTPFILVILVLSYDTKPEIFTTAGGMIVTGKVAVPVHPFEVSDTDTEPQPHDG